jgi:hypothetical protein
MGLSQTVSDLSLVAFDLLGDLKTPVTYVRDGRTSYDPVTETYSGTDTTLTFEAVIISEEAKEREGAALTVYDAMLLVHSSYLDGLVPAEGDVATFKGSSYKVNRVSSPPSNPIYKLYLVRV